VYLASLIRYAHKTNGLVTAYVYGSMGHGKTSYALWTAYAVLGSWDRVLDYLFFDIGEAVDLMIDYLKKGKRIPILILDDAGFYLNRLTWWEKDKILFMELFNLARTMCSGIIFTSPTHELPRQILAKTNYRVKVRPLEEDEGGEVASEVLEVAKEYGIEEGGVAVARGFIVEVLPSFFKIVRKDYLDYFPLWYPHKIYEEYNKIRINYVKRKLEEIKKTRKAEREELFEKALELYKKTKNPKEVYHFLKPKLPASTAWGWAYIRIPRILGEKSQQAGQEQ